MSLFDEASEEERASWRSHPMTAAFLSWLDERFNMLADSALAAVRADRATETKIAIGHLDAISAIRAAVAPQAAGDAMSEDEFVDPAAIWRK